MATNETVDVLSKAEQRLTALARENKRLRVEANELRRRLAPGKVQRLTERAYDDAYLILHYRYANMEPSRRWLEATGVMSARRYGWATALLRLARLDDVQPATIAHLDQCLARLRTTADVVIEGNDMDRLRMRGNFHIRNKA